MLKNKCLGNKNTPSKQLFRKVGSAAIASTMLLGLSLEASAGTLTFNRYQFDASNPAGDTWVNMNSQATLNGTLGNEAPTSGFAYQDDLETMYVATTTAGEFNLFTYAGGSGGGVDDWNYSSTITAGTGTTALDLTGGIAHQDNGNALWRKGAVDGDIVQFTNGGIGAQVTHHALQNTQGNEDWSAGFGFQDGAGLRVHVPTTTAGSYNRFLYNAGTDSFSYADTIHLAGILGDDLLSAGVAYQDGQGDRIWTLVNTPSAVPVPAAAWLFGSALIGLVGVGRRKRV